MADPPDRGTGPTRDRIVTAAVETIKTHGLAGASARAIAKTGGFNQALIYYYFPSLTGLYLAAQSAPRPGDAEGQALSADTISLEDMRLVKDLVARVGVDALKGVIELLSR